MQTFLAGIFAAHGDDPRVARVACFLRDFFLADPACGKDLPKYETILSFLDLALRNESSLDARYHERALLQLRDDLLYLIWVSLQESAFAVTDPLHARFVRDVVAKEDAVLSLNYDLLVDHALCEASGVPNYGIAFTAVHAEGATAGMAMAEGGPGKAGAARPALLKLHGSLNWLFCPTCAAMHLYVGKVPLARIFGRDPELCPRDGTYLKGVLVPPTWVKTYRNPHLLQVWLAAEKRLREAGRVVFIGYSLASTDMQVLLTLCKALHNNPERPTIEVVNPERRDVIHRRYRRAFGKVLYHPMTFAAWLDRVSG